MIRRAAGALDIPALVGPFLLGIFFNYILWGVQISQSYYYFQYFRKTDKAWLKATVGLLFVADAVQSICASEAVWGLMVDGWGDLTKLNRLGGGVLIPLMDAFTASIVHCFYAQKIWTLFDYPYNYIWTGTVVSLSCMQFIGGLGATSFMFAIKATFADLGHVQTWTLVWLATASVTDIVITALMTWKLSRSRTGYRETDDVITKLIRFIVETGLSSSVVQILEIITGLAWPLQSYNIIFAYMVPKVYSNSMLALLNSRESRKASFLRDARKPQGIDSIRIHTSQSVAVDRDYELEYGRRSASKNANTCVDRHSSPDLEGLKFTPFNHKEIA